MSLNTAHHEGGVLIHQGEMILLHAPNSQITFTGSQELKMGEKTGNAYLTTHRLIFLAGKNSGPASFSSFSFPFCVLSEVDVEQPMFGANFLKGKVRAQPDGGWKGEAKFKLVFKSGGAIDFAQGMVRAMQLARQMNGQSASWNTPPPSYNQATTGPYHEAPPDYYGTPSNVYGWMPPAYNFPAPQAGTVFINDAPPPYPGMTPAGPPANGYYAQGPPAYPQGPMAAGFPQGAPGGYPQAPMGNGYAPQAAGGYPQAPMGNGYNPQGAPGYPQAPMANGIQQATAPGFNMYPPPQNGYAFANGNQAFVPASAVAPPTYDEASKKTN